LTGEKRLYYCGCPEERDRERKPGTHGASGMGGTPASRQEPAREVLYFVEDDAPAAPWHVTPPPRTTFCWTTIFRPFT
jgi:hypothetical protein